MASGLCQFDECSIQADECCLCSKAPIYLCKNHVLEHQKGPSKSLGLPHWRANLEARNYSEKQLIHLRREVAIYVSGRDELLLQLNELNKGIESINAAYEKISSELTHRKESFIEQLTQFRDTARRSIEKITEQVILEKLEDQSNEEIIKFIHNPEASELKLYDLQVMEHSDLLSDVFQISLTSKKTNFADTSPRFEKTSSEKLEEKEKEIIHLGLVAEGLYEKLKIQQEENNRMRIEASEFLESRQNKFIQARLGRGDQSRELSSSAPIHMRDAMQLPQCMGCRNLCDVCNLKDQQMRCSIERYKDKIFHQKNEISRLAATNLKGFERKKEPEVSLPKILQTPSIKMSGNKGTVTMRLSPEPFQTTPRKMIVLKKSWRCDNCSLNIIATQNYCGKCGKPNTSSAIQTEDRQRSPTNIEAEEEEVNARV